MGKRLSYLFAAALWLASVYQLAMIFIHMIQGSTSSVPVLGPLLRSGVGPERAIALLLIALFTWVLLDILLHAARIWREERAVAPLATSDSWFRGQVRGPSLAAKRVGAFRNHSPSQMESLSDVLAGASGVDAASVEGHFSHSRALVWALPVLGFIGTALGLTVSIGGFSEALRAADQSLLINRLAQEVIPGLSGAFAITMAALGAATIGHLCVSALHTWNCDVLNELDADTINLLSRIPRRGGDLEQLIAELRALVGLLQGGILDQGAKSLLDSASALKQAAQTLAESAESPYHVTISRSRSADGGAR